MNTDTLNIVKQITGADNHGRSHSGNRLVRLARVTALKIFETPSNRTQAHSGRRDHPPYLRSLRRLSDRHRDGYHAENQSGLD